MKNVTPSQLLPVMFKRSLEEIEVFKKNTLDFCLFTVRKVLWSSENKVKHCWWKEMHWLCTHLYNFADVDQEFEMFEVDEW